MNAAAAQMPTVSNNGARHGTFSALCSCARTRGARREGEEGKAKAVEGQRFNESSIHQNASHPPEGSRYRYAREAA